MSGWQLLLQGIKNALKDYLASAERARLDEMELKILRELLDEIDNVIAPIVAAAASGASGISEATIERIMDVMRRAGAALARYARDNIADYIEDKSQSNATAVEASARLYDALTVLLSVIENQRQWLDTHFPRPAMMNRYFHQPYHYIQPLYFAMQAVELASMLDSVMLEAERAQRDLTLAHHPTRYILPDLSATLTPATSKTQAPPASQRKMSRVSKDIRELKEMYYFILTFIQDFARQAKTRLEQHTRPGGGISAIIVRAQITLTISFCLQSRVVVEGIRAAIVAIDQNVIDIT